MAVIERSIVVDAPADRIFAYLADPMTMLEYMPSLVDVRDVKTTEQGVGTEWRWTYKMAGLPFDGQGRVTEFERNRRRVIQTKGGIDSTWKWDFKSKNGATDLRLVVEYTIPIPVLGKLAESLVLGQNERMADLIMGNVKDCVEAKEPA